MRVHRSSSDRKKGGTLVRGGISRLGIARRPMKSYFLQVDDPVGLGNALSLQEKKLEPLSGGGDERNPGWGEKRRSCCSRITTERTRKKRKALTAARKIQSMKKKEGAVDEGSGKRKDGAKLKIEKENQLTNALAPGKNNRHRDDGRTDGKANGD